MVSEGLAISSGRYWTEEAAARQRRAGIWAGGFDTPRDWRDDHARPQGAFGWLPVFWP
jgi:endonuclease YncB( thermonuclease family)